MTSGGTFKTITSFARILWIATKLGIFWRKYSNWILLTVWTGPQFVPWVYLRSPWVYVLTWGQEKSVRDFLNFFKMTIITYRRSHACCGRAWAKYALRPWAMMSGLQTTAIGSNATSWVNLKEEVLRNFKFSCTHEKNKKIKKLQTAKYVFHSFFFTDKTSSF